MNFHGALKEPALVVGKKTNKSNPCDYSPAGSYLRPKPQGSGRWPMEELDQYPRSKLMHLPPEIRLLIYEELLKHDGVKPQSLSPQLLLTCKTVHREAQCILDGNMKRVGFVRLDLTGQGIIVHVGSAQPIAVGYYQLRDPETSFNIWSGIRRNFEGGYLIVRIKQGSTMKSGICPAPVEYRTQVVEMLNKLFYTLVTALSDMNIKDLELVLDTSSGVLPLSAAEQMQGLWAMSYMPANINVQQEGLDADAVQSLLASAASAAFPGTALSHWISLKRKVTGLAKIVKEAGTPGKGIQFAARAMEKQRYPCAKDGYVDDSTEFAAHREVLEARSQLNFDKWAQLEEEAKTVLRKREEAAVDVQA